jgi:hypothetical protein
MTLKEQLDDVLTEGVFYDIYRAEDALSLYMVIGQNSAAINTARFGPFFGTVQTICFRYAILATSRLFDPPHRTWPTRSLPVAFKIVDENSDALPVLQRIRLLRFLKSAGQQNVDALTDKEMARRLVEHYRPKMANVKASPAMAKLLMTRDKHVAHNERTATPAHGPSIADIQSLLRFAKDFLSVFASAFLSVIHQDDEGKDFVSAGRSTAGARKVLKALEIQLNEAPIE